MKDHAGIIVRNGPKSLFVQRSLKKKTLPGMWAFPSGTVGDGERVEETAVREAKEELGVKIKPVKLLAVLELPEMDTRLHFVLCELSNGDPTILAPDEIEQIRWMGFEEFFDSFDDSQIGHGLVWLRTQPKLWQKENL